MRVAELLGRLTGEPVTNEGCVSGIKEFQTEGMKQFVSQKMTMWRVKLKKGRLMTCLEQS